MKLSLTMAVAAAAVLMLCAASQQACAVDKILRSSDTVEGTRLEPVQTNGARLETLWIFDADYEDFTGANAGWTTYDRSGEPSQTNYWHHDTIRLDGHTELGDSTWWCGTNNVCWRQPRGYGNDWLQILERQVDATGLDGTLTLEWDQRFAMEKDYDYGYVDVRSTATSDTWYTVTSFTNFGFAGTPGLPTQWGAAGTPDQTIDISSYGMGLVFDLRFRFDADGAYSAQDQYNNAQNSVKDGAWQLDNIVLRDDGVAFFTDDAESYGQNGWITEDSVATGQTGVTFWRGRFGIDFVTGRTFTCDDRPLGSWMYVPISLGTGQMVDNQYSWLMSPPIDVSGAEKLVGSWDYWLDMPSDAEDLYNISLASDDLRECVTDPDGFVDEEPGWWFGGPYWNVKFDDWDAFAGNDWLAVLHEARNDYEEGSGPHKSGYFVNRTRVGIPEGDAGTQFDIDIWNDFNDWFQEQIADALLDTAEITIADDDDIAVAYLVASNDGGANWESYECRREDPEGDLWIVPPPVNQIVPGSEIFYYYSATDGVGNSATHPDDAPARYYEMSILPLEATVSEPGLLLVDKHRRRIPGETRNYDHTSQYYYREMLGILGYDWETYEVEVESGSIKSEGPDSMGMKYYDTQIWFSNRFDTKTIKPRDQEYLINWLSQSGEGKERNLLITGNDWAYELMETARETLGFFETWLSGHYIDNTVGSVTVDSVPTLSDHAGGYDFMTYDDGRCIVVGGCPYLQSFDVIEPASGSVGTETVADYIKQDTTVRPAGFAYTHGTLGYQAIGLGFGIEFMMDSMLPSGYYETGIWDRQNLMQNIMDYFGKTPDGPGTGVVDGGLRNALSHAYPNPFNPVTKIAYSVKESGPVSIEVYNVAGRVVRTLLSEELDAGTSGYVVWDGRGDGGEKCASGVYFYRIAAPGFSTSRKMVMLK
jgi:hypothetical protein